MYEVPETMFLCPGPVLKLRGRLAMGGGGGGAVMWNGLGNNETKLNYFKYALTVWNWGGLSELR